MQTVDFARSSLYLSQRPPEEASAETGVARAALVVE